MKKYLIKILCCLLVLIFLSNCSKNNNEDINYIPEEIVEIVEINIKTDKAVYAPGEKIVFSSDNAYSNITIKYKYLNKVLSQESLSGTSWEWYPPSDDFKGYMIELYRSVDEDEIAVGSVAVDVSSDWTKFPRYGFLSKFGDISDNQMNQVIDNLKDYHINGLQYYDWHNKHHLPLKMDGDSPASNWLDIAKRDTYFRTVENYIQKSKEMNIASMSYNLLYGAWEDFATDEVSIEWMLFNDSNHQNINKHDLDDNWALSDILVLNPANTLWQDYIFQKTRNIYNNLDFDGWHLDQLGNRGKVYNYNGDVVNIEDSFGPFLSNLKNTFPNKKMVLNAVNQYGQSQILNESVDFAYTEVWDGNEGFDDLASIIQNNNTLSNNSLNTVLAAYLNYDLANNSGVFNTPSVLLADAVIFAFGGSHLELGEHMLGKEYFPNNNLNISSELKKNLRSYYNFLVAYQNLLRDGGTFNNPELVSGDGKISLRNWPPVFSKVSVIGKEFSDKQIIHLINFSDSNILTWRDTHGDQNTPQIRKDFMLNLTSNKIVTKVWYASPDLNKGSSRELEFTQNGNNLVFKIPSLQYWGMIVVEYN
ncbi:glycoside hydrolase family 66 protein [uncultured Lutibacter sp.]|uniref:glycoside hydrolase family 66 protein n=1 Tax=uncultured Lutibacter sp. TaxID=437739 RepID=UPI00261437B0|nr:glycoside hydrolase family 66 protein [uncultured Lutibacter sp.]